MRSLKATAAVSAVLLGLGLGSTWLTAQAQAQIAGGAQLPLCWRVALALWNAYVRWQPLAIAAGLPAAALAGALFSSGSSLQQERRLLAGWLALAAAAEAWSEWGLLLLSRESFLWWLQAAAVALGLGLVAYVSAVVVSVHLQARLAATGTRVKAWHVAVGALLFTPLGPAALLVPLAIWWHSASLLRNSRPSPGPSHEQRG